MPVFSTQRTARCSVLRRPYGSNMQFYCQKLFFFQVGFPPGLKPFPGPVLCNYWGSRPVWVIRVWLRAGTPLKVGRNLVLGHRGPLWIKSASKHARVLNLVAKLMFWGMRNHLEPISESPRSTWRPWTGWRGCRRSRSTSRSEILSQLLSMLETWFWWQNQCFGAWGIIWNQFQKAPDRPEGHEQGEGAVGGQEALQRVKIYLSFWAC